MTKYMLILGGADLDKRSGNASLAPEMFRRYSTWLKSLHESGRYVDSYKIHEQTGARLTVRGRSGRRGPRGLGRLVGALTRRFGVEHLALARRANAVRSARAG